MIDYPQTPEEWRIWISERIGISKEQAIKYLLEENFPLQSLLDAWITEFTPAKGYSPDFVPALSRNQNGFLSWVYADGSEPNWSKCD